MAEGGTRVGAGGARGPTPLARELGFSHLKGKRGAEKGRRASGMGVGNKRGEEGNSSFWKSRERS